MSDFLLFSWKSVFAEVPQTFHHCETLQKHFSYVLCYFFISSISNGSITQGSAGKIRLSQKSGLYCL